MLRFPILECRKHICQRIRETVGADLNLNHENLDSILQLNYNNGLPSVDFRISTKDLKASNIKSLLNIKSDAVIKTISIDEVEGNKNIIFHIDRSELIRSVLKTSLNSEPKDLKLPFNKKVLVEFSSPNIAKPFHLGHLRSTIIGNFVANIIGLTNIVKRFNYIGDWGTQIGYIKLGLDSSDIQDIFIHQNPLKELGRAYSFAYNQDGNLHKAKEIFSQLEKNNSEWSSEWEKIRFLTLEHLKKTYSSFGIAFDEYLYESDYRAGNISHVVSLMKSKGLTSLDQGCLVMDMDGIKVPLFKSDGTSLYLIRDIASALERICKNECDDLIYVVDKSQSEHLKRLKFAINKLVNKNVIHVTFGRITGMSTRKGTSIFLSDLLNQTVQIMATQQLNSSNTRTSDPETTRILGISSLIVYILKYGRNRDFKFSWENVFQGSGDAGSKLQYTHCRLCSLEKNCSVCIPKEVNTAVLVEPIILELIFELARFQDVLRSCQDELESSLLISYNLKLCNTISRCLKVLPVKGQPLEIAEQRLLLFHTAKNFLHSSMKILGLHPLDEM